MGEAEGGKGGEEDGRRGREKERESMCVCIGSESQNPGPLTLLGMFSVIELYL